MPKKSATTRSVAQRNRPKVQKSFEVVRQTPVEQERIDDEPEAVVAVSPSSPPPQARATKASSARKTAIQVAVAIPEVETVEENTTTSPEDSKEIEKIVSAPKGS